MSRRTAASDGDVVSRVPLGLASLLAGLVQSPATKRGLFRRYSSRGLVYHRPL